MFRPVRQSLVRRHPVTGRPSLYLSSHAGAIVGMPMPEARILLRDLTEHATQPRFVYVHRWRQWERGWPPPFGRAVLGFAQRRPRSAGSPLQRQ